MPGVGDSEVLVLRGGVPSEDHVDFLPFIPELVCIH